MNESVHRGWLGVVWLCLLPSLATAQVGDPIRLETGLLSGVATSDPAVTAYKGIPFAARPIGDLRWRPPAAPHPWDGVRTADTFGPGCNQQVVGLRLPWTEEFMHQGEVSEDCLSLNVWTARERLEQARPVLVYIHGGGFSEGSGSVAVYDGTSLARKGLVLVTINYRLGVLGFLAHPELTAESGRSGSGNYGLLDQIAALRWINRNIAAFGGDPNNVTIAGQSAGAISVYLLTTSPLATGLFHRAIVQSGPGGLAAFGLGSSRSLARPLADEEARGAEFAVARGASSLQVLRTISVADLTPAPAANSPPLRFGPVIDGYVVPDSVHATYARGAQNDVPLLTGFNADEASAFPGYGTATLERFRTMARERYGEAADAFLALYPAGTDRDAANAQKISLRHAGAVALGRLALERAATAKTDAYLYYFQRGIPWPEHREFGAFHTAEVPYVFENLDVLDRPWEAVDRRLAGVVAAYWVNFATRGDPNGEGLPAWPAFRDAPRVVMELGEDIGPREIPADSARRAFLDARLGQR